MLRSHRLLRDAFRDEAPDGERRSDSNPHDSIYTFCKRNYLFIRLLLVPGPESSYREGALAILLKNIDTNGYISRPIILAITVQSNQFNLGRCYQSAIVSILDLERIDWANEWIACGMIIV